jgi:uncharacterized protein YbjQ (UPF0145 family)
MPLFGGPSREQRQQMADEQAKQQASVASLEAGGLPLRAQERIAEMTRAAEAPLFTSDLTPQEAALLRQLGYQSMGLVVGSCFYHVGLLTASYSDGELVGLTKAYHEAQDRAVSRIEQEATGLQADGIVGVRFEMKRHEWAEHLIEVTVMGTAIHKPGTPPRKAPFLSDISGQEFWELYEAGYEPRDLVYGNCVWVVFTSQMDEWRNMSIFNQEIIHMSNSVYQCRSLAMQRLQRIATTRGAQGVVGVKFDRRIGRLRIQGSEQVHHAIYLTVIGTSIVERRDAKSHMPGALSIIDLRDRVAAGNEPADVTLE